MSATAPAILFGRLPPGGPAREPLIVTTLRRCVRRQAPQQMLDRVAGGAQQFRDLDAAWALRATVTARAEARPKAQKGGELGVCLSLAERQIALQQMIAEHDAGGPLLPGLARLARLFGTTAASIENDLAVMVEAGRIRRRRWAK
jgi:hypothetical protein